LIFITSYLFEEENTPAVEENKETNTNNKWKKYLDLIEKAVSDYKECESQNCSCYKKSSFLKYNSYLLK